MAITSDDIVVYGSANMPEDDTSSAGGAIDEATIVTFTDVPESGVAASTVRVRSSTSEINKTVRLTGRLVSGVEYQQTVTLSGITNVPFPDGTGDLGRILKIELFGVGAGSTTPTAATGTITVSRPGSPEIVVAAMKPGVTSVRSLFYGAAAEVTGGSSKDYYEKVFVKNEHATLTLLDAVIKQGTDSLGKVTSSLGTPTSTIANRLTAPTGTTFNDSDKTISGGLDADETQSLWLKLTLDAGDAPAKGTYTLNVEGTTI